MSNKNYNELSEVIVTSQAELDDIPKDYKGRIYIQGAVERVIISNRYYFAVVLRENSTAELWENSTAELWENSTATLRGNSTATLRGNSTAEANGNAQVVDMQTNGKILLSGNARKVFMPKTIHEFMDFYGIKHTKKKAIFYKAVHKKSENTFCSDWDISFKYAIGETIKTECDLDESECCGHGIHIAHLNWALNFGANWINLAIIEVETDIDKIVMPKDTDGKVRTSEVKVIREVPLEECGIYGKILAKRRNHER